MGDATMGMQARLMSQALRKLSGAINQTKTAVIFTNQLRQKIGVMFGNPETTTGGQALKFYASVRLDVRRIQAIKVGDEVIGNRTRVKVVKNKVAPPFRTAEFDIMFNEGISRSGDMLDLATKFEVVPERGAFFSYGDIRIGQGRENAKEYLRQNPDLMNEIEAVIRQKALSGEIALPAGYWRRRRLPAEHPTKNKIRKGDYAQVALFIFMICFASCQAVACCIVLLTLLFGLSLFPAPHTDALHPTDEPRPNSSNRP